MATVTTPLLSKAGIPPFKEKPSIDCMFREGKLPDLKAFEPFCEAHGLSPKPLRQLGIVVKNVKDCVSRLEAVGFGPFLVMDLNAPSWIDGTPDGGRTEPRRISLPIALAWRDGIEIELIQVGTENGGRYRDLKIANDDYEFDHVAFLESDFDEKGKALTKKPFSYKFVGEGVGALFLGTTLLRVRFSYYDAGAALPGLLLELSKYEIFGISITPPDWLLTTIAWLSKILWLIVLLAEVAFLYAFHAFLGVGRCATHEATPQRMGFTIFYLILIVGGLYVANTVSLQILMDKQGLINPSLRRDTPGKIFIWHFFVCFLHTVVLGPLFLANDLRGWYWASFIGMLVGSLPVVQFNYNPESFGKWVGTFVVGRNIFELLVSLVLAAGGPEKFSLRVLSVYHYWIWGYRFLDVGPRRLLRALKVQPWFIWFVIFLLYLAIPIILWNDLVIFAGEGVACPRDESFATDPVANGFKIMYPVLCYLGFHVLWLNWVKEVASYDGKFDLEPHAPSYKEYISS